MAERGPKAMAPVFPTRLRPRSRPMRVWLWASASARAMAPAAWIELLARPTVVMVVFSGGKNLNIACWRGGAALQTEKEACKNATAFISNLIFIKVESANTGVEAEGFGQCRDCRGAQSVCLQFEHFQ